MQLSKEQSLALMQKFATDDAFRAQFESDPATALAAAGVSKEQIAALAAGCLTTRKLAGKEVFAQLGKSPDGDEFRTAMSFSIHHVKLG